MNKQDEAASLKQEAQSILSSTGGIRRAASYRPTLEELESTPFYAYVRHRVLGVPNGEESENTEDKEENDDNSAMEESDPKEKATVVDRVVTRSSRRKAMEAKRLKKRPAPSIRSRDKKSKPCKQKLADGIAKVTLPEGWWDHEGIGKDVTARGKKVSLHYLVWFWIYRYMV